MKNIKNFILAAAVLIAGSANAQKWSEGKDLSYLKGQKEILLKFTYDNMKVSNKMKPEAEWVKEKVEEQNKKEAGKGDAFAKAWVENRANVYEPKFEELFNKEAGENLQGDRTKSSAKYTLIVHTTRTEQGYNIGISKAPASIDFEFIIVETANPSVIKSKGVLLNVPGSSFAGADFDVASRLKECYAKSGKTMGKKLGKACKSK
jgi:hypothetical protein